MTKIDSLYKNFILSSYSSQDIDQFINGLRKHYSFRINDLVLMISKLEKLKSINSSFNKTLEPVFEQIVEIIIHNYKNPINLSYIKFKSAQVNCAKEIIFGDPQNNTISKVHEQELFFSIKNLLKHMDLENMRNFFIEFDINIEFINKKFQVLFFEHFLFLHKSSKNEILSYISEEIKKKIIAKNHALRERKIKEKNDAINYYHQTGLKAWLEVSKRKDIGRLILIRSK